MPRQIIVAENSGFCFGVKRAVDMTVRCQSGSKTSHTYTLGPLIHNGNVVRSLREQGVREIGEEEIGRLRPGDTLVIRSHGVTPDVLDRIQKGGVDCIDATCPYVSSIQKKARKYHEEGYRIVIVGDRNHPEVIGINGWCGNTAQITRDGSDLKDLPDKVCVLCQTTEKPSNYEKALEVIARRSNEVLAFNTICSATKKRQDSADQVSRSVDRMVVVGGRHSSNTGKLFEICSANCRETILVENSTELPDWPIPGETTEKVGVAAGASTPDWVIQDVLGRLREPKAC